MQELVLDKPEQLKALGHPLRVRVLEMLGQEGDWQRTYRELAQRLRAPAGPEDRSQPESRSELSWATRPRGAAGAWRTPRVSAPGSPPRYSPRDSNDSSTASTAST